MDELIDILDSDGKPTGRTAMKSIAHKNGWFHPSTHIWFYTCNGEVLIQQRAKNKDTHPLFWDVSVAGHIGAGEAVLDSALREIEEEIGLAISKIDLKKIGVYKSIHKHSDSLIDCEYHHTFLCELKVPLDSLMKQESEVEAIKLMSLKQFETELQNETLRKKYVPYPREYYQLIIDSINTSLNPSLPGGKL